ncbi:chemotaxis protein [Methylobacterium pseudosasicola]|uniref:Chemotaxis protein MotC n=1 Tax=Methylobacterium pseudosasicola TaxID=582667 RepID=A0A1I4RPW0_9HYPH|nr:chemotaxis protein [Methylobacterium pseudosasicola]SFM54020.1 chemotaxis protein MotC [Methylobacterium pseudosasicola]
MRRLTQIALGVLLALCPYPVAANPEPQTAAEAAPQAAAPPASEALPTTAPTADLKDRKSGPVEWVRTLQLLQDRIAAGSLAAHKSQPILIARIEGDLLNAAPEVWTDRHNVQAAIVFALSGGGPAILRRLTKQDSPETPETDLARGALAYIDGQEAEAGRLLRNVDTAALPTTLAGAIALTQAALTVTENPVRAIALLDRVRLLMPGTLVEEGALRREIFALGQGGDLKKFEVLAIQYLRRFQHSIYAGNFRQRFAYQLTQLDFGRDETRFASFTRIMNELAPESRRDLYLLIARTAVQAGKTNAALMASDKALVLCAPESPEATQAQLYRAAAEIVTLATFQTALRKLQAVDRAKLPAHDVQLLDAALSMAEQIGRGLARTPAQPDAEASKRTQAQTVAADEPGSLIPKAEAMIGQVDQLLRKSNP